MSNQETATLAGGCFWCLEAVFDEMKGVLSVDQVIPMDMFPTLLTAQSATEIRVCGSGADQI